ncbi:O-antigen ligase family protein [Laspinema olomoucense]|uniref:O-antigen ligase family protein n=1 Tax=Laspinema olomoucense D3b TaxID=2953688 RepID=A0ABT2N3C8_9CYAN|nr:O-antigen ligase family protein [Laspinema sp. D3b]MCT7976260.1 O-antigen ligase family protein [Laspinema sp. D3b]
MASPKFPPIGLYLTVFGTLVGVVLGAMGTAIGIIQPILLALPFVAAGGLYCFFTYFEVSILGLLIVRTSLDVFSAQQMPALWALAMIALTLLYVLVRLLIHQPLQVDGFWWFLLAWLVIQGLWVILLPLGGLGFDGSFLPSAIREWVRLFSWVMIYLLVMQLKGRVTPQQAIACLFLGLVIPAFVAILQLALPPSVLPPMLVYGSGNTDGLPFEAGSRINGTLGHPNTFTTFLVLFLGLTYWKQQESNPRWPWAIALAVIAFLFVNTKSLFGLMMLATLILALIAPKLSLPSLLGGIVGFGLIIALFGSTEFGQERLGSLGETPLGNPDMELWRAILLAQGDGNSFNWRLAQWTYLIKQWQDYPLLGFGLGTNKYISANGLEPHNDYVRALVEGGVVGFVFFLLLLLSTIARLIWLIRAAPAGTAQRNFCFTLLAIWLSIPVGMITENIWTHTSLFLYWWTMVAIAGWDWDEKRSPNSLVPSPTLSPKPHPVYFS